MRARADLHVHSSASDGRLEPAEVVRLAADKSIEVLSLTDHDSMDGVAEALHTAESLPLLVIPGVELSARTAHGEAHVLGYFVDPQDRCFAQRLCQRREGRDGRAREIVERLHSLGYGLSWERVCALANGGSVGRPHIARALVDRGYVADVQEAFDRLLGKGAPAYLPNRWLDAAEAVQWILEAGGLPVLAHPLQIVQSLPSLMDAGLAGIEVYYAAYGPEDIAFLSGIAERYNLLQTGGSDFHGLQSPDAPHLGQTSLPWEHVERLLEAATQLGIFTGH